MTDILANARAEATATPADGTRYVTRLGEFGPVALACLREIYGTTPAADRAISAIFATALAAYIQRPARLRDRDAERERDPEWYLSPDLVGAWCYVDRFASDLSHLAQRVDYLEDLGVRYLHLMPLFARPEGPNDGGYAVSDYRTVHPPLGTMDDLRALADLLHDKGMSLAVDFVFNHTSSDHPWALAARAGSVKDRECYLTFASELETQEFAPHLRAIFPAEKAGAFVFDPEMGRWVWSTFHGNQWDLDYRNPEVFRRMLGEMLFLANIGVDVLRLDAVPFIWKEPGTTCENLPGVHSVLRAMNALVRVAAPASIFKSEAIVHPDEVRSYLGGGSSSDRQCELSYNPLLMVELWEALATEHVHLLRRSVNRHFSIPGGTSWVNYVRSHDDIGWGFADEDAQALSIDPSAHRHFLQRFYTGHDERSFGRGADFQPNPMDGDVRLSGTTASLAGLELAITSADEAEVELAIRRILLIHGIVMASPGIPLLRVGDDLGALNDDSYLSDPGLAGDSRWMHRPHFDWTRAEHRNDPDSIEGRIHQPLAQMARLRAGLEFLKGGASMRMIDIGNDHVYVADIDTGSMLVVGNFTAVAQRVDLGPAVRLDLLGGTRSSGSTSLAPYELLWLIDA